MKIILSTGFSSLLILASSFVYVSSFEELSTSQAGGLGFLLLPFLVLAGFLSLFSMIEWTRLVSKKRIKTTFERLSVLPSLPMVGLTVLVVVLFVYRG